jgi:putative colanic acid biosynthesis UDP-glucose lipid carrier transferase
MAINSTRRKRLLQNHDTLMQWVQHLLNAIVVVAVLLGLVVWRDGEVGSHYRSMLVFGVLVMMITYHMFGVHRRFDTVLGGIQHLARAWGVVIIILAWVAFLTKTSEQYSRQVVVYWAIFAFIGQALAQLVLSKIYRLYSQRFREKLPALVVGTGSVARHLAKSIASNIWLRDRILGVVTFDHEPADDWNLANIPILGE